jgi:hypothetical protein
VTLHICSSQAVDASNAAQLIDGVAASQSSSACDLAMHRRLAASLNRL